MKKEIIINREKLATINKYLTVEPKTEDECLSEDETITYTAVFDDGYEVDVKCCGVQFREGESNLAWSEAVLFKNGMEVCCTEPEFEFDGEWELADGNKIFTVLIREE